MGVSYSQINSSDLKLDVLLYRLSQPKDFSKEYFLSWSRQPLHQYVFEIVKELAKHQQRINSLKAEQDFIREQMSQVAKELLTPEDGQKVYNFLQREYQNLIQAESAELKSQLAFLQKRLEDIQKELVNQKKTEEIQWNNLLTEQVKNIGKAMKNAGLKDDFNKMKRDLEL